MSAIEGKAEILFTFSQTGLIGDPLAFIQF